MIFQCMFAVITPALMIGAFCRADQIFILSRIYDSLGNVVYDPLAPWLWGTGGWLKNLGALDFAGGIVVHYKFRRIGPGDVQSFWGNV